MNERAWQAPVESAASVPDEPATLDVRLGDGDFDEFFGREYPRLVTLLTAVTGHRMVAEELAQETMLRAHQRWSRISGYDVPEAWLRRVGLNLAYNNRARRRSERDALNRLASQRGLDRRQVQTADIGRDDGPDGFWSLVRALPRRQATALALHYLEDRSVEDVAQVMGCAVGTAKAHLHKGRNNLNRLLAASEGNHGHQ